MSLVDVPGHERFVRHMVAGASGVDGYLLCVAADDGVMPQTREHLAVLRLLGVEDGVVAITRADLAPPDRAAAEARDLVGAGPEIVPVSAVTGEGVDRLRAALDRLVAGLRRRTAGGRPRLFVDRSFSLPGAGTVVTGTLWGEGVGPGDRIVALPGGAAGRVREVQAHDRTIARAAGGRTALNLAGVARGRRPARRLRRARRRRLGRVGPARRRPRVAPRRRAPAAHARAPAGVPRARRRCRPAASCSTPTRWSRASAATPSCASAGRCPRRPATGWCCARPSAAPWAAAPSSTPRPPATAAAAARPKRLAALESGAPARLLAQRLRDAGPDGLVEDLDPAAVAAAGGTALPGRGGAGRDLAAAARGRLLDALASPRSLAAARAATGLGPAAADALIADLVAAGEVERHGADVRLAGTPRRPPGPRRSPGRWPPRACARPRSPGSPRWPA